MNIFRKSEEISCQIQNTVKISGNFTIGVYQCVQHCKFPYYSIFRYMIIVFQNSNCNKEFIFRVFSKFSSIVETELDKLHFISSSQMHFEVHFEVHFEGKKQPKCLNSLLNVLFLKQNPF